MIVRRYISAASVACFTLALSGSAYASDVAVTTTGADSNQQVIINNSSSYKVSNTNNVQTTNVNIQDATSGDITANKNTVVGGLVSGDASNNNATVTTIDVSNAAPVATVPVTNTTGTVGGQGTNNAVTPTGGSVLGAATAGGLGAGVAMLPVTGPSMPIDVSALRAAWNNNQVTAPSATLAQNSRMFTGAMLLTALLLSLVGALGSAWYARRHEERV